MVMDYIQEEIDNFVNGDINEQIEKIVEERFSKLMKGKSYTYEEELDIKENLRLKVRQEILDKMAFKRRYNQEKHLDDLQDQQRRYDHRNYQAIDQTMINTMFAGDDARWTESEIYSDINGVHPNTIVSDYQMIADFFNMYDTLKLKDIITSTGNEMLDSDEFQEMILDEEKKKIFRDMVQKNGGNLNLEQLSEMIKELTDSRAMGYMDDVINDINTRILGIEGKTDALNHVVSSEPLRTKAHLDSIDMIHNQGMSSAQESVEQVQKAISLSEIEALTENVRAGAIRDNIRDIKRDAKENVIGTQRNMERE